MNIESDIGIALLALMVFAVIIRLKPSVEDIHSIVEMTNTKGGIILVLWLTSLLFFIAGIRLMYWTATLQIAHPNDPSVAFLNTGFNWISGGAFGGAFGAMIATMKGDALPSNGISRTITTSERTEQVPSPPVPPAPVP